MEVATEGFGTSSPSRHGWKSGNTSCGRLREDAAELNIPMASVKELGSWMTVLPVVEAGMLEGMKILWLRAAIAAPDGRRADVCVVAWCRGVFSTADIVHGISVFPDLFSGF